MKIDIINANSDLGVHVAGADLGPRKICANLDTSKYNRIVNVDALHIEKSKNPKDLAKNLNEVNEVNSHVYEEVKKTLLEGRFPLLIGGDHSVAIGSALASKFVAKKKMGIIWIDAHGDFNTFGTTITGNLHGLPYATITGYECFELRPFSNDTYEFKNAVIVGARALDPLEEINLRDAGVTVFTSEDVKKYGAKEIMKKAIDVAACDVDLIHISFDIDVIDPVVAPGVSVPEINGISSDEAYEMMDVICENKNKLNSFDVVEYNPLRDIDDKTLKISLNIINKLTEIIK